jgi:hypothetical protein
MSISCRRVSIRYGKTLLSDNCMENGAGSRPHGSPFRISSCKGKRVKKLLIGAAVLAVIGAAASWLLKGEDPKAYTEPIG